MERPEDIVLAYHYDLFRQQHVFWLSTSPEARLIVDDVVSLDPYWLEQQVIDWIRRVAEYEHWEEGIVDGFCQKDIHWLK